MNNIVTLQLGQAVTTSLAIASGTENDHASVIKLVRVYQQDLEEFGLLDFKSESTAGRPTEFAILNEQQSTLLLTYMRNSDIVRQFKKALVKAFYQFKQAPTINPAELSRLQLIQLAMQAEQERIVLEQKVEILEPKAQALDRFATYTDGSFCIRDAAKTLQVKEKNFIQILYEKHWIYRRPLGAGWLAYSDKLQAGVMEHKITTGQKADGSEWANTQPRITARGLAKLAQLLRSNPTGASPA